MDLQNFYFIQKVLKQNFALFKFDDYNIVIYFWLFNFWMY